MAADHTSYLPDTCNCAWPLTHMDSIVQRVNEWSGLLSNSNSGGHCESGECGNFMQTLFLNFISKQVKKKGRRINQ